MFALAVMTSAACHKNKAPVARPATPASMPSSTAPPPPSPPSPVPAPTMVPPEPLREDPIASASLDDLNKTLP
jgi:hypothetical protein